MIALLSGAAAALLLQAAGPEAAAVVDPNADLPSATVVKKKDRIVCEKIRVLGSWEAKRVCRTVEDKERHREASQRKHEAMANRGRRN